MLSTPMAVGMIEHLAAQFDRAERAELEAGGTWVTTPVQAQRDELCRQLRRFAEKSCPEIKDVVEATRRGAQDASRSPSRSDVEALLRLLAPYQARSFWRSYCAARRGDRVATARFVRRAKEGWFPGPRAVFYRWDWENVLAHKLAQRNGGGVESSSGDIEGDMNDPWGQIAESAIVLVFRSAPWHLDNLALRNWLRKHIRPEAERDLLDGYTVDQTWTRKRADRRKRVARQVPLSNPETSETADHRQAIDDSDILVRDFLSAIPPTDLELLLPERGADQARAAELGIGVGALRERRRRLRNRLKPQVQALL